MKYKILIFDLDDTLLDNRENIRASFKQMLKAQGEIYSDEKFERWHTIDVTFWVDWQDGKIPLPERFAKETGKKSDAFLDYVRSRRAMIYFNNEITDKQAVELTSVYTKALTEIVIPIDGAYETLKYLHGRYTILVATNGPNSATRAKLQKIGALDLITEILSADMFGYMKPRVEFFEHVEARYQDYDKRDYLIIGNSLKSDVGLGMNAGIDSCWYDRGVEQLTDKYTPTFIIKRLSELKDTL